MRLDNTPWACMTAYKMSIEMSPFWLVYDKSCYFSVELEHRTFLKVKQCNIDLEKVGNHKKLQLNKREEILNEVYDNTWICNRKTKVVHDKMISKKDFQVGQKVLLFNFYLKLFSDKFVSHWISSFIVTNMFSHKVVKI